MNTRFSFSKSMICLSVAAALAASAAVQAADHLDSPIVKNDPAADINDLFAFVNPNDASELVLVMDVVPVANRNSRFSDAVDYLFHYDNGTGDKTIACKFSDSSTRVSCAGPGGLAASGPLDQVVNGNGMRVFAGLADDPFFFDFAAFNATKEALAPMFTNPGTDFFLGLNTLTITIGVKNDRLISSGGGGSSVFKTYASTKRTGDLGIGPAFTGHWYDPANSGHGVQTEIIRRQDGSRALYANWYVYDPNGNQAWVTAIGPVSGNGTGELDAYYSSNGAFPPIFGAGQPDIKPWGKLKFDFTSCDSGTLTYNGSDAGWGSGTVPLTRITNIEGVDCHLLSSGQIDRMGRPGINTVLINLLPPHNDALKDQYNQAVTIASWSQFTDEIKGNLTAIDTLDGTTGNTVLPPADLASVLVDDRLIVDVSKPLCDAYLAVELGVAGQCGGRTLSRDIIDDTLGAIVGPGVSDNVSFDSTLRTDFPFIGVAN